MKKTILTIFCILMLITGAGCVSSERPCPPRPSNTDPADFYRAPWDQPPEAP